VPQKPPRLQAGQTIAIIAPASAPPDPKAVDYSVGVIEGLGFKARLAPNVRKRWGFLAGSDRERASDIMKMFRDRSVHAILCIRGGYGTARLLGLLDYQAIRAHPKALIGFSDITSLHCAFLVKSNLVTFHGPMLNSDFNKSDCPEFTIQSFLRTLMSAAPPGSVSSTQDRSRDPDRGRHDSRSAQRSKRKSQKSKLLAAAITLSSGRGSASGPLIGGNLSLLCATIGTPWQPSFRNKILFFEDLDEVPYRFDRMLTHLLHAGLLQQVEGVAIGTNSNCEDPKRQEGKEYRQTLQEVLTERLRPLKVPVVINLPFGHVPCNATLPIGIRATLDPAKRDLIITEPAVM
jgi:muramoyltetrapeptide carboxypeptidase